MNGTPPPDPVAAGVPTPDTAETDPAAAEFVAPDTSAATGVPTPDPAAPPERRPSELARLVEVRRVGSERAGEIGELLSGAFVDDPLFVWLFAGCDATERIQSLRVWWRFMLAHPPPGTETHVSGDGAGAAVWHAPGRAVLAAEVVADFAALVGELCGERAPAVLRFVAAVARAAPSEPHWHLAVVGVAAGRRNEGLGARLLAPVLARCDRTGVPAYLESANPANLGFYRRLGFRRVGEVGTVDGAVSVALLWRRPQPEP